MKSHTKDQILIVEDSEYMRACLVGLLENDYEIHTAANGKEAMALIRNHRPSLILSDIMMPEMDGFELLQKLRGDSKTKHIPFILLTGRTEENSIVEGFEAGADDYLTKPVRQKELMARVKTHLELHRSRQQILKNKLKYEKKLNKKKDEFIEIASHELKTPLTCLSGYIQLLEATAEDGDVESRVEYVRKSRDMVDTMSRLINDLLNVTKMQAGQLDYKFTEIGFYQFIESTIVKIQDAYPSHKILLSGDNGATVKADRERLEQVVINYISNAVKYSPHSDKVEVCVQNVNGYVQASVEDTGVGIPKDKMKHLFKRFYRVDHKKVSGIGLGLYICSEIIKNHGGEAWAESVHKKGSKFFFSIPVS